MKISKDEKIQEYLADRSVLLVTDSSTDRAAWKKFLHDMGVKVSNFSDASKLDDALEALDKNDIDIVFTTHIIAEQNMIQLIDAHIEKYPERNGYFCFMVTEKNSLAVAAFAAEHDVDSLIVKPYNQADLIDNIGDSILSTIDRKEELTLYYKALGSIRSANLEVAEEQIQTYLELKAGSANAHFLKGLLMYHRDEHEQAVDIWEQALEIDPGHHQSLCHIFDTLVSLKKFVRAYPFAANLSVEYPINPERIPNFIRVSLATEAYQNLIDFCELIISLDDDLSAVRKPIAAALAVSAKNLVDEKSSVALVKQASIRAMELTDKDGQIYVTCMENLYRIECYKEVKEALDAIPSDEMGQSLIDLELLLEENQGTPQRAFVMAQGLVKLSKTSETVYFVLVRTGKLVGKSKQQLEDIIYDGAKLYPYIKGDLLSLLEA
jgi:tetratricopeptide (TPR) repeat protein